MSKPEFLIGGRTVGVEHSPFVIAEIGINHDGNESIAAQMIDAAAAAGAECVKFQTHVVEDEMIPNDVVPGNASEPIYQMMQRCALSAEAEARLKQRAEAHGMIFLSTPFSRAAANRLNALGVSAYKVGSGECNNYPLIEHIARFGKPVILSTGMNDIESIAKAVQILRAQRVPFALLHCTSLYPTPYKYVRLGAMGDLGASFPDAVVGLSDHSPSIYPCLGAVALGASILERHFTDRKDRHGPDIPVSMDPGETSALVEGARAIHSSLGGRKAILDEEEPTIRFAYACVVTTKPVAQGEALTDQNIWVKRPGTGEIRAKDYSAVLGRRAGRPLSANTQLRWGDLA